MDQKRKEGAAEVAEVAQAREASPTEEEFFPKGAIAFFVTMIAGFGLIWLGMYWMLVHRNLWL